MQMDSREAAAVTATGGAKPPTMCDRLHRAFHARPAFRPLRRLTGRPQDGGAPGAAATGAPGEAVTGTAAAHGGGPRPPVSLPPPAAPVTSPVGKAPAPTVPPTLPTPVKPAAARGGVKPQRDGQNPAAASTPTTVTATTGNAAEKAAGGMPVPVPPSAVIGMPPAGDKEQLTKVKARVGSRVRKALASSK